MRTAVSQNLGGAAAGAAAAYGRTLLVAAVLVLGCSKPRMFGDQQPPDALGAAPAEIASTICPKAYQCCTGAQLMGNNLAGTDVPSCEMKTTESFQRHFASIRQSQEKGRALFQPEKLMACLAYVGDASCEALNVVNRLADLPGCESFVKPLVQAGGACGFDWECIAGACVKETSDGDGTCRAHGREGEACATNLCAEELACDSTSATCVPRQVDGAPCTGDGQCMSNHCALAAAAGGARTCAPPPSNRCFYASACALGGNGRAAVPATLLFFAAALAGLVRRRSRAHHKVHQSVAGG
jgi:hypothetical protein